MVNRERGCVRCRGPVGRCGLFEVVSRNNKNVNCARQHPCPQARVVLSKVLSPLSLDTVLSIQLQRVHDAVEAPEAAKARLNDCEKMVPILQLVALRFLRVKRPEDVGHRNTILSL